MAGKKPDISGKNMQTTAAKDAFYRTQLETAKRNLAAAIKSGDEKRKQKCEQILCNLEQGRGRL